MRLLKYNQYKLSVVFNKTCLNVYWRVKNGVKNWMRKEIAVWLDSPERISFRSQINNVMLLSSRLTRLHYTASIFSGATLFLLNCFFLFVLNKIFLWKLFAVTILDKWYSSAQCYCHRLKPKWQSSSSVEFSLPIQSEKVGSLQSPTFL